VTIADGLTIFSLQIVGKSAAVTMVVYFSNPFFNKVGQRWRALLGGLIVSFSIFLGYFSLVWFNNYISFLILQSVVLGAGTGIAYTAPLVILQKWMPANSGQFSFYISDSI